MNTAKTILLAAMVIASACMLVTIFYPLPPEYFALEHAHTVIFSPAGE